MPNVFHNAFRSIRKNKLRSFLAGFGIAWGIFLLVILLGFGNGFRDGVMKMFDSFAQKSLFVYGGRTSKATKSINNRTQVIFHNEILNDIRNRYKCITFCSEEMSSPTMYVSYNGETKVSSATGVDDDYFNIKLLQIKEGRFFSQLDIFHTNYVTIIGEGIKNELFEKESCLGKEILIGDTSFEIIGVLSSDDLFSMSERNSIYIPSSTFITNFSTEGDFSSFCISLGSDVDSKKIERDIRGYLAYKYGFDPHDEQAVIISNIETQTKDFDALFNGLKVFIWIVGLCLLLSGIVGVCNIMLIIVKERTSEIGIRKAVGATSSSVITMILAESVMITVLSGIIGVVFGRVILIIINKIVIPLMDNKILSSVTFDAKAIVIATIVLGICGMAAGLFPAIKASGIAPVDAIRYENRE